MNEKETRKRKYNRLIIDMIVDKIIEVNSSISDYSKYMDENSFAESNEVESLYEELNMLGLELYHQRLTSQY